MGRALVESEPVAGRGDGRLQLVDGVAVEGIGVGGHSRALGKDVEAGEEAQSLVEVVIIGVAETLGAGEFEGEQRQEVLERGDRLGAG